MSKKNKGEKKPKPIKIKPEKEKKPSIAVRIKTEKGNRGVDVSFSPIIKIATLLISAAVFLFKVTGTVRKIKKFFKNTSKKRKHKR